MEEINFELDTNIIIAMTIIFIALRLTHMINWSWIWVFSPIWLPVILAILAVLINKLIALIRK